MNPPTEATVVSVARWATEAHDDGVLLTGALIDRPLFKMYALSSEGDAACEATLS